MVLTFICWGWDLRLAMVSWLSRSRRLSRSSSSALSARESLSRSSTSAKRFVFCCTSRSSSTSLARVSSASRCSWDSCSCSPAFSWQRTGQTRPCHPQLPITLPPPLPPPATHLQVGAVAARCLLLLPPQLPQLPLAHLHLLPQALVLGHQQVPVLLRIRAALRRERMGGDMESPCTQGAPACCPHGSPSPLYGGALRVLFSVFPFKAPGAHQSACPFGNHLACWTEEPPAAPREPRPTEGLSLPTAV